MVQNCLTCEYEPEWSEWSGGEYRRCYGTCRFAIKLGTLPQTYRIENKPICRFGDDSGIPSGCKAWGVKK